jgi:hypothetical protein
LRGNAQIFIFALGEDALKKMNPRITRETDFRFHVVRASRSAGTRRADVMQMGNEAITAVRAEIRTRRNSS